MIHINTAPATEPVTRAEAALFMRYTGTLQNDVIDALITTARQEVEKWTCRTLVTTTYDYYTDQLYDCIELPTCNAIAVSAITYLDTNNTGQTLTASLYELDKLSYRNVVRRAYNQTYPAYLTWPNGVKITFTAGYGAASAVPECLKTVIKMIVAELYENREGTTIQQLKDNPAIKRLLNIEARYIAW